MRNIILVMLIGFVTVAGLEGAEKKGAEMAGKYKNRLANETSPYLLQHADNPVDWWPWGDEAFAAAKEKDMPVFLSIGYSTCHWCHVMEHESFENEKIAAIMNKYFICIKVDREERPDVDEAYMVAVRSMTGGGGWPMSVFMTADGKPFHGGTYYPPEDKYGRMGFEKLLLLIADSWENSRSELLRSADTLVDHLNEVPIFLVSKIEEGLMGIAAGQMATVFDYDLGGFGRSPKFPQPSRLSMLMVDYYNGGSERSLLMVEKTLQAIADGGIHDHLGGGFYRYSTDPYWLVPHFEKMLYDQGLLCRAYLQTYQLTGKEIYADTARDILDYVLEYMTDERGGFYSAEDADSEGVEGKFYVWKKEEIEKILLKKEAEAFNAYYNVTDEGDFEGENILHVIKPASEVARQLGLTDRVFEERIAKCRGKLLAVRDQRVRPLRDDKIIAGWNGLMISAMARGGAVLGEERYVEAAERAAGFVIDELNKDGRLGRYWRDGKAVELGILNDYAYLINGLLDLYGAGFDVRWLEEAKGLGEQMVELFVDEVQGGFNVAGKDGEVLVLKRKSVYDGAMPSGNSAAAMAVLRLGHITGDTKFTDQGEKTLGAFGGQLNVGPMALTEMLIAVDYYRGVKQEIVIALPGEGAGYSEYLKLINKRFLPRAVVIVNEPGEKGNRLGKIAGFVEEQKASSGRVTVYLCENYACKRPVTTPKAFEKLLDKFDK